MKDERNFWNKQAKRFNSDDDPEMDRLVIRSRQYIGKSDVVLDFACGAGVSTYKMADSVASITGVDYSEEMIRYARQRCAAKNNVGFVAGTIDSPSIGTETFDVVVAYNILHLLDDIDGLIKRVNEVLKPGGRFIAQLICLDERPSLGASVIKLVSRFGMFPTVAKMNSRDLKAKFEAAGFETIECDVSGGGFAETYIVMEK